MRKIASFLLSILVLSCIGCRQSAKIPEDFDYGKIENGHYQNKYFNLDVAIPQDWNVQNKGQMDSIRNNGREMISETNKDLADKTKASDINTATLLAVFQYTAEAVPGAFNPSFLIMGENVMKQRSIKNGEDYLEQAKKLFLQAKMGYVAEPDFGSEEIGGKKFSILRLSRALTQEITVSQSYYTIVDRGFALSFIISSANAEQLDTLKNILHTLKFN